MGRRANITSIDDRVRHCSKCHHSLGCHNGIIRKGKNGIDDFHHLCKYCYNLDKSAARNRAYLNKIKKLPTFELKDKLLRFEELCEILEKEITDRNS